MTAAVGRTPHYIFTIDSREPYSYTNDNTVKYTHVCAKNDKIKMQVVSRF